MSGFSGVICENKAIKEGKLRWLSGKWGRVKGSPAAIGMGILQGECWLKGDPLLTSGFPPISKPSRTPGHPKAYRDGISLV